MPTQGRISASRPSATFSAICGSARCARVMPTMSSLPLSIAWRAVATSWMRAAWKVGRRVSARTSPAKSRCGAERSPMPGMTRLSPSSVSIWPRITLRKSISPEPVSRRAIAMPSSRLRPRSQSSSQTSRAPRRKSGPTRRRTASNTAMPNLQAVVERSAIFVLALVGGRRPELIDEMAVAFEFEPIEPAGLHPLGRVGVSLDHAGEVPILHRLGEGAVGGLADRRGRDDGQPVVLAPARAAAEMGDLDHHRGALVMDVVGQFLQPAHAFVLVEKDIAERLRAVLRHHRRAADHGERDAAFRLFGVIEPVALFGHAVLGIGRLVRGRHQAVAQRQAAQLKRLQQRIAGHAPASKSPRTIGSAAARGQCAERFGRTAVSADLEVATGRRLSIGWGKVDLSTLGFGSEGRRRKCGTNWTNRSVLIRAHWLRRRFAEFARNRRRSLRRYGCSDRDRPVRARAPRCAARRRAVRSGQGRSPARAAQVRGPGRPAAAHEALAPAIASAGQVEAASGVKVTRGSGGPPKALIIDVAQALGVKLAPAPGSAPHREVERRPVAPRRGRRRRGQFEVYARAGPRRRKFKGRRSAHRFSREWARPQRRGNRSAIAKLPGAVTLGFSPTARQSRNGRRRLGRPGTKLFFKRVSLRLFGFDE